MPDPQRNGNNSVEDRVRPATGNSKTSQYTKHENSVRVSARFEFRRVAERVHSRHPRRNPMRLALTLAALFFASPVLAEDYPSVVLKNDKLKFTLYEPDAKKGFYRGTRFDHAGVFGHVEFAGHKIFGPWKDTHDPTNHDDIVGPCEEFGNQAPLGFDDAKVGETFLK